MQGQLQGRLLTPSAAALAAAALIWAVRQHLEEEGVQEEEEELGLRRPRRAHELSEDLGRGFLLPDVALGHSQDTCSSPTSRARHVRADRSPLPRCRKAAPRPVRPMRSPLACGGTRMPAANG